MASTLRTRLHGLDPRTKSRFGPDRGSCDLAAQAGGIERLAASAIGGSGRAGGARKVDGASSVAAPGAGTHVDAHARGGLSTGSAGSRTGLGCAAGMELARSVEIGTARACPDGRRDDLPGQAQWLPDRLPGPD